MNVSDIKNIIEQIEEKQEEGSVAFTVYYTEAMPAQPVYRRDEAGQIVTDGNSNPIRTNVGETTDVRRVHTFTIDSGEDLNDADLSDLLGGALSPRSAITSWVVEEHKKTYIVQTYVRSAVSFTVEASSEDEARDLIEDAYITCDFQYDGTEEISIVSEDVEYLSVNDVEED